MMLEKKIALSKQEPDLLSGTIIDNILFGWMSIAMKI